MLKLYRRHLTACKHAEKGTSYAKCACPIWVDGMRDGKRIRYSLNEFNWEEASKRLLEINAREERKASTIAAAIKDFHDDNERRGLKSSSTKKYKELLAALVKFCDDRAISTVRALDLPVLKKFVETFADSTLVQGKKIERLRTFMRQCEDMGWIDNNPATKIKKPKVKNEPVKPFTDDEIAATLTGSGTRWQQTFSTKGLGLNRSLPSSAIVQLLCTSTTRRGCALDKTHSTRPLCKLGPDIRMAPPKRGRLVTTLIGSGNADKPASPQTLVCDR